MEKVLTISVAAYNIEKYVDKLMESFSMLSDDNKDKLEVLIVNDGSTDNTKQCVTEYLDKYPDTLRLCDKSNGGYGSTINYSIGIAKGKYFKQLDGDDWFVSENLKGFIDFLDRVDSDLVITPLIECYETENNSFKTKVIDNHLYLSGNPVELNNCPINKNVLMHELTIKTKCLRDNNIRITENCFYTDNEYVVLPFLKAETICKYSKAIYCYRLGINGQSVSLDGIRRHYKDMLKVSTKLVDEYIKNNDISDNKRGYLLEIKYPSLIRNLFITYMVLEKPNKVKHELMDFDVSLKRNCPELYQATMKSKYIRILRHTKYIFYGVLCRYVLHKFIVDHKNHKGA